MVHTKLGSGYSATAPSEQQTVMVPASHTGGGVRTGIVYCHSLGALAPYGLFPIANTSIYVPTIARRLADRGGYPVLGADLSGDPCGNDTGIARVADARTHLQSAVGAKSGKVILMAWSEGGAIAMSYARANPGNVAAMILFEPLSDLQDIVTRNPGGNTAAVVNAAFGGAYSDATHGPTHSPVQFAAQLSGIPTLLYYATDDTTIAPASVATVAAGIGASCEVHTMTGGHGDGALGSIDAAYVLSWLRSNVPV